MKRTRCLMLILALALLLAAVPAALAESPVTDFTWQENGEGGVTLAKYTGNGGDVAIPAQVDGKPVTAIDGFAFSYCISLTGVTIPESVTEIGDFAFAWCKSLTSVTVPDGVTAIGGFAFAGCESLTSVTIADSVTAIGDDAFLECASLTEINACERVAQMVEDAEKSREDAGESGSSGSGGVDAPGSGAGDEVCPDCGGDGIMDASGTLCTACGGTGRK